MTSAIDAQAVDDAVVAALDELDAISTTRPDEPWRIGNHGQADWAARKLARTRAKSAEVRTLAQRQRTAILDAVQPHLQAIDDWANDEEGRLAGEMAHWESLLSDYHRSVLAEDPRAKSIRLPHAILHSRKGQDEWQTDDAVLIEWVQREMASGSDLADLLRKRVEINRVAMKQALSVAVDGMVVWGGELVPGVRVLPGATTFSVETEEGK